MKRECQVHRDTLRLHCEQTADKRVLRATSEAGSKRGGIVSICHGHVLVMLGRSQGLSASVSDAAARHVTAMQNETGRPAKASAAL